MPEPSWVKLSDVEAREREAEKVISHEAHLELAALDGLAELAVPDDIVIRDTEHDPPVTALLGLESSLFSDLRAFRHLTASGFMPEALQIARAIYIGLWKAEACVIDPIFAACVAEDEEIRDVDVRRKFAHVRASAERPGDWDHEAEQLALVEDDYVALTRLTHKRKGGSEFQASINESGDTVISRQPPSMLVDDLGASIIGRLAMEAARVLHAVVPLLLQRGGVDPASWYERFKHYAETRAAPLSQKWADD